jgi:site-specific DNA-methyltransferase (adenine-specific)
LREYVLPWNVLEFPVVPRAKGTLHDTEKPIALMEYLVKTYTNEGDVVLDFCFGSGTTGHACANTGRRFIGIEKDAEYFRIGSERIASAYEAPRGFLDLLEAPRENDTSDTAA